MELDGLADALARLAPNQQRAILLREWQGLSYREIAHELGVTEAAVETLLFRARRSLARRLDRSRVAALGNLGSLAAWAKSLFGGAAAKLAATAAVIVVVSAADPALRQQIQGAFASTPPTRHAQASGTQTTARHQSAQTHAAKPAAHRKARRARRAKTTRSTGLAVTPRNASRAHGRSRPAARRPASAGAAAAARRNRHTAASAPSAGAAAAARAAAPAGAADHPASAATSALGSNRASNFARHPGPQK